MTRPLRLARRSLLAAMPALMPGLALPFAARPAHATAEQPDAMSDADGGGYHGWFKIMPRTARVWQVSQFGDDRYRVTVRLRQGVDAAASYRILVLYPRESSAYDVAISRVLDVLAAKGLVVDLTVINFRNDDQRGQFAVGVAATGKYDLILSMGSESTAWLWNNYRGGRVPIVTVCSKDPVMLGQVASYDAGSGTSVAFTSLNVPVDVQMAYVAQLRPNLRNLGILVDGSNVSAVETQAKPIAAYAEARGIRVLPITVTGTVKGGPAVRAELEVAVRDAAARMGRNDPNLDHSLFYITGSTTVFQEIATINAQASRVPVLSTVPEVVQAGDDSATLSIGVSFESNAHLAAVYAVEVMTGRSRPGDLKVGVVSPPDIAISFRKARDIGLHIPFEMFESANAVFDYDGRMVRSADMAALAPG